jgi:hypothetical protein
LPNLSRTHLYITILKPIEHGILEMSCKRRLNGVENHHGHRRRGHATLCRHCTERLTLARTYLELSRQLSVSPPAIKISLNHGDA